MKRKVNKKNAGFSLLEVILSMAILALISIPLLNYFSDSMRYSVMMAKKQKATILAQQITENLKTREELIAIPVGETYYSIPYLDGKTGYVQLSNTLAADGKGTASYKGVEDSYDVVITCTTTTAANDVTRPVIYGIDDTTDVLAVEREQKQEAVAYFMAINNAYASAHGTTLFTSSEVEAKLDREIQILIGMDGANYTVKVYYDYTCRGLRETDSVDNWVGSYLLDVKIGELKSIYLLYDRLNGKPDEIVVQKTAEVTDPTLAPELFLICQNTVEDEFYRLKVHRLLDTQVIHTNISNTELGKKTGQVIDGYGNNITDPYVKPLTGTDKPVRMVKITTEIYEKGHTPGDEPLAVMETTKGE